MPAPTIIAVTPTQVAAAGSGSRCVQVVGTNFDATLTATIAGAPPTVIEIVSQWLVQLGAAAHAAGPADISIMTSSGTATRTAGLTYV